MVAVGIVMGVGRRKERLVPERAVWKEGAREGEGLSALDEAGDSVFGSNGEESAIRGAGESVLEPGIVSNPERASASARAR